MFMEHKSAWFSLGVFGAMAAAVAVLLLVDFDRGTRVVEEMCNIGHLPRSVRSGLEGQTRRAGTTAALHRRCANKYIRAGRPNSALPVTYGEACL